jgi:hypothetical protein
LFHVYFFHFLSFTTFIFHLPSPQQISGLVSGRG